jgi:hypothetical protein
MIFDRIDLTPGRCDVNPMISEISKSFFLRTHKEQRKLNYSELVSQPKNNRFLLIVCNYVDTLVTITTVRNCSQPGDIF